MPDNKRKPREAQPTLKGREDALKAALSGLGLMVAAAGIPPQVRLSSREQQPGAIAPPKKRSGR
jgi:hypothetical protein